MSNLGNKDTFARNLRFYVEKSGMDRRQLAEIWGFPYSTVTEWMNAKKYPRIDRIEIIANYFGILKSDLIEEKGIENSPAEMSELHVDMITDRDFVEMYGDFRKLDAREKRIIKDLAHSMAATKKEA